LRGKRARSSPSRRTEREALGSGLPEADARIHDHPVRSDAGAHRVGYERRKYRADTLDHVAGTLILSGPAVVHRHEPCAIFGRDARQLGIGEPRHVVHDHRACP